MESHKPHTVADIRSPNPFTLRHRPRSAMSNSPNQNNDTLPDVEEENTNVLSDGTSKTLNLEEMRLCNEIIERLKTESAGLEDKVLDQSDEIKSLKNQVKRLISDEQTNSRTKQSS